MSTVIYKYNLPKIGLNIVPIPRSYVPLSVGRSGKGASLSMWAMVEEGELIDINVWVVPTGDSEAVKLLPPNCKFIGTDSSKSSLIFHIFVEERQ